MAERWQQWMPFHIDKFRGSPEVQAMHPAARAGYLYLLASMWQTDDCTISSDPLDLATESGLGDELWAIYGPRILRKFVPVDSRLRNPILFEEWEETKRVWDEKQLTPEQRAILSEQRRAAGIIGNQKRWGSRRKVVTPGSQNIAGCDVVDGKDVASDRLTGTGTGTGTNTTPLASTADAVPAAGVDRGRVLGTLPCAGGKVYQVCEDDLARDGPLYPAVDVAQEYRAMKGWLMADPRRQKTTKGIRRFMASWLTRAQDSGRKSTGGSNGTHRSAAQQREDESRANIDAAGDWLLEKLHGASQIVLPEPDHHGGNKQSVDF